MRLLAALFAAILSAGTFAQESKPAPFITWRFDKQKCPECSRVYVEGDEYRIINDDLATVAVHLADEGKRYRVEVYVRNKQSKPVDLLPQEVRLNVMEPASLKRPLNQIPAAEVARKVERTARWQNFWTALGASLAQNTTTVQSTESASATVFGPNGAVALGSASGSSSAAVTTPNAAAQAEAARQSRERAAAARSLSDFVLMSSLKANTLAPGVELGGDVYFEKEKNAEGMFITLRLDGKFYGFLAAGPKRK
jgi:hypothetical protein